MPLTPTSNSFIDAAQEVVSTAWGKLEGLFGHQHFSPSVSLESIPGIDPRFLPRVPMANGNLDVHLLGELGKMGMKRGKEITPETHPEFHREWVGMCQRAGLARVPQLILAESKALNAASFTGENAVVMTTGLMQRMNFREVRAVLGHELGHEVSDHTAPRIAAIVGLGGGGALVGNHIANRGGIGSYINYDKMKDGPFKKTLQFVLGTRDKRLSLFANAFYSLGAGLTIGSIAANQLTVHPTELDADKKGAMISGDPEALISALTKLEENHGKFSIVKAYRKLKSGYPSMETRIERLREVARSMPPQPMEQGPVMMPEDTAVTPTQAAPSAQIHAVSQAERVASPVQAPIAAL
jgi:heat shock protein HtpX